MTEKEMQVALRILSTAYPRYFRDMTYEEKWEQVKLYMEMFGDIPENLFATALKNYIKDNEFPPTIAGLKKQIDILKGAVAEDTIESYIHEAWAAVEGSKKFEDLSDPVKEYFGSQRTIDAIGQDENTIYTVFVAQVQRRLPDILLRQKTKREMSPELKSTINNMLKGVMNDVCDDVSLLQE